MDNLREKIQTLVASNDIEAILKTIYEMCVEKEWAAFASGAHWANPKLPTYDYIGDPAYDEAYKRYLLPK